MLKKLPLIITIFIFVVQISGLTSAKADDYICIYDYTYGEILQLTNIDYYESLIEEEREFYNTLPAEEVLGYDENDDNEIIYSNSDFMKQLQL